MRLEENSKKKKTIGDYRITEECNKIFRGVLGSVKEHVFTLDLAGKIFVAHTLHALFESKPTSSLKMDMCGFVNSYFRANKELLEEPYIMERFTEKMVKKIKKWEHQL